MSALRDGPILGRNNRLRLAFWTAALLALLFIASGAALWHLDAPGSTATCPICHAAHMPALGSTVAEALASPEAFTLLAAPEARIALSTPVVSDAPPRAPPLS